MKTSEKSYATQSTKLNVLIEFKTGKKNSFKTPAIEFATKLSGQLGIAMDQYYDPVEIRPTKQQVTKMSTSGEESLYYVLRAEIDKADIPRIEKHNDVVHIWDDPVIDLSSERHWCPDDPTRNPGGLSHRGSLTEVLNIMNIAAIRSRLANNPPRKAIDVYVGVVDGGITSRERVKTIPRLSPDGMPMPTLENIVGGWPNEEVRRRPEEEMTEEAKWGMVTLDQNCHGNAMASLIQAIAPDCKLLDMRIAEGGTRNFPTRISNALQAYRWAIRTYINGYEDRDQHLPPGTPQILTNSWCLFDRSWLGLASGTYAQHMDHPFNRIVSEAIDEGMIVIFCAGNCGGYCRIDARCGSTGPGNSIWGANAHPQVITVGAVTKLGAPIGYSSLGPAMILEMIADEGIYSYVSRAIDKPDLCCYSAFTGGYYAGTSMNNSGTSSATALVAGVVALLKKARPNAGQSEIKLALLSTARNIWDEVDDPHSIGRGVIQPLQAFERVASEVITM